LNPSVKTEMKKDERSGETGETCDNDSLQAQSVTTAKLEEITN